MLPGGSDINSDATSKLSNPFIPTTKTAQGLSIAILKVAAVLENVVILFGTSVNDKVVEGVVAS